MNKQQYAGLAKFSYKIAEILVAGVVIAGFMQPYNPSMLWKMIVGAATAPVFIFLGLALDGQQDDEPP